MGFLGSLWSGIKNLGSKVNSGLSWLGNKVIKPVAHFTGLEYLAKPISWALDKTAQGARWLGHHTIGDTATAVLETGWGFTPWGAAVNAASAGAGVVSGRHDLGLGTILDVAGGAGKLGKIGKSAAGLVKGARGASKVGKAAGGVSRLSQLAGRVNRATAPAQRYIRGMSTYARGQVARLGAYGSRQYGRVTGAIERNITKPLLSTRAGKLYTKAQKAYEPYKPYVDLAKKAKSKFGKAYTAQRALTRGGAATTTNETFTTDERQHTSQQRPHSVGAREGVPNVYATDQGIHYDPPRMRTGQSSRSDRVSVVPSRYSYNIPYSAYPRLAAF